MKQHFGHQFNPSKLIEICCGLRGPNLELITELLKYCVTIEFNKCINNLLTNLKDVLFSSSIYTDKCARRIGSVFTLLLNSKHALPLSASAQPLIDACSQNIFCPMGIKQYATTVSSSNITSPIESNSTISLIESKSTTGTIKQSGIGLWGSVTKTLLEPVPSQEEADEMLKKIASLNKTNCSNEILEDKKLFYKKCHGSPITILRGDREAIAEFYNKHLSIFNEQASTQSRSMGST